MSLIFGLKLRKVIQIIVSKSCWYAKVINHLDDNILG